MLASPVRTAGLAPRSDSPAGHFRFDPVVGLRSPPWARRAIPRPGGDRCRTEAATCRRTSA